MAEHIKGTPHSPEVIQKIVELHDAGMRSKSISLQSKELIGYKIQQSSISMILRREGRDPKTNTYRRKGRRTREEMLEDEANSP